MKFGKLIFVALLLITMMFTSCDRTSSSGSFNREYYVGTEGVEASFQRNSPPSKLYYHEDFPEDNVFQIHVDVINKGSSHSKGGIYLTGYDPSKIKIEGIDIDKTTGNWNDCDIGFALGGTLDSWDSFWKGFQGSINCVDRGVSTYYQDDDNWGFSIEELGQKLGIKLLEDVKIDFNQINGQDTYNLNFGDNFQIDALNHGAGLLVLMSGMSFNWYNGREYLLNGNTIDYPGGERTIESFEGTISNWPEGLNKMNAPFQLVNCYLYSTFMNVNVCIDPEPYDERKKVCSPGTHTFSNGQGAPVGITKVETISTKSKVVFHIEIKNLGDGQVFNIGSMTKCGPYSPGRLTQRELNQVYILDARVGDQQLKCTPDRGRAIDMVDGSAIVDCTYLIDYGTVKSAYETPLIVELGYGYQEIDIANMEVIKI